MYEIHTTPRGKTFRSLWEATLTLLLLIGCQSVPQSPTPAISPETYFGSPIASSSKTEPVPAPAIATPTEIDSNAIQPTQSPSRDNSPCQEAHGRTENQVIPTDPLRSSPVQIYLPPCYSSGTSRRYPALYLLHGSNTDNTQWIQLGVTEAADRLIRAGQIPAFLVIMPKEALYRQDPNESTYGNWIIHFLIPWIDQSYATCADRSCRAIGGLSRGGSWAFRIGLTDWKDFSAIGMDSSVPFSGDLATNASWFTQMPADQRPRFYIDMGNEDANVMAAFSVVEELTKLRLTVEWHLSAGAHNRAYWRLHVEDYLRWYAKGWK